MGSFRFLHAADIHLDSPLTGLGKFEEASVGRIQTATREALEGLVACALDEGVDFLVIAGDLYDGDWKDHRTGLFFVQQMGRLNEAGIPVFVLNGNHDAASQITKSLQLPDNVRVFNHRKAETFALDRLDVVLHGRSFPKQHVEDNLVPGYPAPTAGHFNIGVLHTALEGGTIHADYAPCTVSELRNKGYDYWALGHVHEHNVIVTEPHVVYPGNLQGRSIREIGPKGACLVAVEDGAVSSVDHVPLDVVRWALLELDVSSADTFIDVTDLIAEAIHSAVEERADGRFLACRIVLKGETKLDGQLRARRADLRAEAIGATFHRGEPEAWIEKVRVTTSNPAAETMLTERSDALSQVLESIPEALEDDAFTEALTHQLQAFRAAVPHEVLEASDDELLAAVVKEDYATLLEGIRVELAAALLRKGK
jgi:DNA repair exonuclease SbcCD nuclease subunit